MQPNKKALQLFNNTVTLCWLKQIMYWKGSKNDGTFTA